MLNQKKKKKSQNSDITSTFKMKKLKKDLANWRRIHKEKNPQKAYINWLHVAYT